MSLEDDLRKLEWDVTIDEDNGSLRIISSKLRSRVVIVPRGGDNSITIARIKPSALMGSKTGTSGEGE